MMMLTYCSEDAKILMISGTHGKKAEAKPYGVSALSEREARADGFYKEDCRHVGVLPGPDRQSSNLPVRDWQWEWEELSDVRDVVKQTNYNEENFLSFGPLIKGCLFVVCQLPLASQLRR